MAASIPIKNSREIESMRRSGRAVAQVLNELRMAISPGVTTREIDKMAASLIKKTGGKSAFLNYRGFPGNICISLNEEVVHGIGGTRRIQYGDIVKLDVGIILDGWVGDTATTVAVGEVKPEIGKLLAATQQSLAEGIKQARSENRVGDISAAIEGYISKQGFSVVREFVGHGVGKNLHEEPHVPNYGLPGKGPQLKPGMTLAIEPMVNIGEAEIRVLADGWTVVSKDGTPSAHFEHTVLITDGEPEILTIND